MTANAFKISRMLILLAFAVLPGSSGCLRVVWHEAAYYVRGPQQPEPPNGYLVAGTKVIVFGKSDSYRRIFTPDGTAAYVWKNDLMTVSDWREHQQKSGAQQNAPEPDN